MAGNKRAGDADADVKVLLKKILILLLFELGVPQAQISKKVKIDVHAVNDFLKGVKRVDA